MPTDLQRKALDQLRALGVDVRLGALVTDVSHAAEVRQTPTARREALYRVGPAVSAATLRSPDA